MICRAGIGSMTIIDADCVAPSNINRQLPALTSTVGQEKVNVLGKRLNDINPALKLRCMAEYVDAESVPALLDGGKFDFIVDAIDTISPKVSLICGALDRKIPIISSMGAGAKTDISKIRTADVWETYNCGLSRAVRQALKKRGYSRRKLQVVFSTEPPDMQAVMAVTGERNKKKTTVGTVSYMPAAFGCHLAQYVITHIAGTNRNGTRTRGARQTAAQTIKTKTPAQ